MHTTSNRTVSDLFRSQLKTTSMLSRAALAAAAFVALSPGSAHTAVANATSAGVAAAAGAATVSSPAVMVPPPAVLPTGGTVVFGGVTISIDLFHQIMTILQTTNSSIINWDNFSIGADGTVTFIMPDSTSIALNRVVGGNLSEIFGKLSSNGIIFLINPNGVVFGANANVNVGGLVATTADIDNDAFIAGSRNFNIASSNLNAQIVNRGTITAAQGGLVALVAPSVTNSGIISANLGTIALGGGNTFTLDFYGDGLYGIEVTEATQSTLNDIIKNTGIIAAGKVILTADTAAGVVNNAINQEGIINATFASAGSDGSIILDGGENGKVRVGGSMKTRGDIDISGGGDVILNNAEVQAGRNVNINSRQNVIAKNGTTVDAGSNLRINATNDVKADGSALRAVRNVSIKGSNVTLENGSRIRAGNSVDITVPGAVTLLSDSRIGAGRNITMINRHFYSDTDHVLSAVNGNISFYQSDLFSIQNAIDALGNYGNSATLTLHGGDYWNDPSINLSGLSHLTIQGSTGAGGPSIIHATTNGSVIDASNTSSVTIKNIHINGENLAANGIYADGARALTIEGNNIYDSIRSAVSVSNSNGVTIKRNVITGNHFGVFADNVGNLAITGNRMSQGSVAAQIQNSDGALVDRNGINNFLQGVLVSGSNAINILSNTFSTISGTAVSLTDSDNATISSNDILSARNGIALDNSSGSLIDGNTLRVARNGIVVNRSDNLVISGNDVRAGMTGISLNRTTDSVVDANTVSGSGHHGILVNNSGGITIRNNTLHNNFSGLTAINTNGLQVLGNSFTRNLTGVSLVNSHNALLDGGIFTNNGTGIVLDDSDNARLDNLTINSATGGTGIYIRNGSGGTLVRNLALNGGRIGVLIDGAGSSMQFADSNSRFTGMPIYFWLRNGAMNGEVLDASQQTFDGVRAFDFTPGQLVSAEGKTTDGEDLAFFGFIGDVFYKLFDDTPPPPPPSNLAALNEFEQDRDELFRTDLFSYAGYTIEANSIVSGLKDTNFNFDLAELNLSLLNPAASGINAPQAQTLSIASLPPGELANLSPAAGGNTAALANLAPAAGGPLLSPDCGTSFLDTGFKPGFSTTTCSVQQ
jgi:filamentous hemagglutinin family protein